MDLTQNEITQEVEQALPTNIMESLDNALSRHTGSFDDVDPLVEAMFVSMSGRLVLSGFNDVEIRVYIAERWPLIPKQEVERVLNHAKENIVKFADDNQATALKKMLAKYDHIYNLAVQDRDTKTSIMCLDRQVSLLGLVDYSKAKYATDSGDTLHDELTTYINE